MTGRGQKGKFEPGCHQVHEKYTRSSQNFDCRCKTHIHMRKVQFIGQYLDFKQKIIVMLDQPQGQIGLSRNLHIQAFFKYYLDYIMYIYAGEDTGFFQGGAKNQFLVNLQAKHAKKISGPPPGPPLKNIL